MGSKTRQAIKDFIASGKNTPLEKEELVFQKQSKSAQASQEVFIEPEGYKRHKKSARSQLKAKKPSLPPEQQSKPPKRESQKLKPSKLNIKSLSNLLKEEIKDSPKKPDTKVKSEGNYLKPLHARRLQMMSKFDNETEGAGKAPLQIQLMQSESLKISQEKINSLEEELQLLREKNESLLSAAELLKEQNQELKIKVEESEKKIGEEKIDFEHEKEILLSALSSAKEQMERLKKEKKDLSSKLSNYSYSLGHRENSLEGRIEILKMENTVLQREKDKKIIELRKLVEKNKRGLEAIQKQNQELRELNEELERSSHRAVTALRATIFNLEGVEQSEDILTSSKNKSAPKFKKTS